MLEFRSGGRRVSSDEFFENLKREGINQGMKELEQRIHAAAVSVVDPETRKHADVFVRRTGETQLTLHMRGSPAFACELERHVGIDTGSIETMNKAADDNVPRVYLAHASEDHATLANPLAERLIANGIEVWLDAWEIRAGDSLRRKMEEGLGECTHFVVADQPVGIADLAAQLSDWTPRRLNSALNYLDAAKLIQPLRALDSGPWTMVCLRVTDQTRRFVRDHG